MSYLIIDLATAPIDGSKDLLETPTAPANYKDPEKISAYITERLSDLDRTAALDIDLARISAIGTMAEGEANPCVMVCENESDERSAMKEILPSIHSRMTLIGFNALKYDWPLLMRRCLYLGLTAPSINLDRYRSPHVDLWNMLSHNGAISAHSLTWYAKRLGWTDLVKPLTGAQEATALKDGKIEELRASVAHDVIATYRLAQWLRVIAPSPVRTKASEEVDL